MARLGVPAATGFWVGGRNGRLLRGDAGAIAARIERASAAAKALAQELDALVVVLNTDAAPREDASDRLREQLARVQGALAGLQDASRTTVLAMIRVGRDAAGPPLGSR